MPNQIKVVHNASKEVFEEEVNRYLSSGYKIIHTDIREVGNNIVFYAFLEYKSE